MASSRRSFLKTSALLIGGGATMSVSRFPLALAGSIGQRRLVVIVMRGAVDALGVLPPVGDPDYAEMRAGLAFDRSEVLPLTERFGLAPGFRDIHPWFQAGELTLFPAASSQYRSRSHFDGQAILETGLDDPKRVESGWLGRLIKETASGFTSVGIGNSMPTLLLGSGGAIGVPASGAVLPAADVIDRLAQIYNHDGQFPTYGDDMIRSAGTLGGVSARNDAVQAFSLAGQFLGKENGPRIVVLSSEGWDLHSRQGTVTGRMFQSSQTLSNGLIVLRAKMGEDVWRDTVVLGLSEFGRTVRMNGSGGTDHGTGGFAFLAGGSVNGGRIGGEWPGLATDALYENRDLAPTIDTRALIKAVLTDHLGVSDRLIQATVFPGMDVGRPLPDLIRA